MALQQIGLQAIFEDAEFQKGIQNYDKSVQEAGKSTDHAAGTFSKLGDAAKVTVVAGLAAAAVGFGALVAAAKGGVDALLEWNDQVNTLSDNLGTSGEESSKWAVAFNHVGLSVDEGGAGLNFFTKSLAGFDEAVTKGKGEANAFGTALGKLGVSAFDSQGELRTFDDIMPDLLDAFQTMPAGIDKSALAMELFGARAGTKFLDFLSQGSEGLANAEQMAKDFGLTLTTEGSNAAEDFTFAMNDLQLGLKGVMIQVGIAVLPILREFADFVAKNIVPILVKAAQTLGPFIAGLFDLVRQFVGVLQTGVLFEDFGADFAALFGEENEQLVWDIVNVIGQFAATLKLLADTFVQFFGAVLHGDAVAWLDWTEDVFGAETGSMIIDFADTLHEVLKDVTFAFKAFFDFMAGDSANVFDLLETLGLDEDTRAAVTDSLNEIRDTFVSALGKIPAVVSAVGSIVFQVFGAIWNFLQPILMDVFETLAKFWLEIYPKLKAAFENIQKVVSEVMAAIADFIERHMDDIVNIFSGVWTVISGIFNTAWALISGIVKIALDLLAGDFEAAGKDWEQMIGDVWKGIQQIFQGAWQAISTIVAVAMEELGAFLWTKLGEIGGWFNQQFDSILNYLSSLPGRFVQAGLDMMQGLIDGFWQQAGAIQQALSNIIQAAIDNLWAILTGGGGGNSVRTPFGTERSIATRFEAAGVNVGRSLPSAQPASFNQGLTQGALQTIQIFFQGTGGPSTQAEAETQGSWIVNAMVARGVRF